MGANQGKENGGPEVPPGEEPISNQEERAGPVGPSSELDVSVGSVGKTTIQFTLQEIKAATSNYAHKIGEGGYGPVYRGTLTARQGGRRVAVKCCNPDGHQGLAEWQTELQHLQDVRHPNLVELIGYCPDNFAIVYELMENGSVDQHLFPVEEGRPPLPWAVRLKILHGAAEGLAFLHERENLVLRDFKAANVLLTKDFTPRLSDFGLVKNGPEDEETHISTRVIGTPGYAAPEFLATGHLRPECDVYSFGVFMLEVLSGRRAYIRRAPEPDVVKWARACGGDRRRMAAEFMDPSLKSAYKPDDARTILKCALDCTKEEPKGRPQMGRVAKMLKLMQNNSGQPLSPKASAPAGPH